jgi:hypothetical protein
MLLYLTRFNLLLTNTKICERSQLLSSSTQIFSLNRESAFENDHAFPAKKLKYLTTDIPIILNASHSI